MDAAVALTVANIRLASFRLHRIDAALMRQDSMGGGQLEINSTSALSKAANLEPKYACDSTVTVTGLHKDGGEPVFRISVTVRGHLESPKLLRDDELEHPLFKRLIDQRVYLIAVVYIHQVARGMNLHGVKLPADTLGIEQTEDKPRASSAAQQSPAAVHSKKRAKPKAKA